MSLSDLLKRVSVFSGLSDEQIDAVEKHAERRSLVKGEQLITEGDRAKRVFVLISGKLAVLSNGRPIAEVLPGEPIGELAFFAGGLRTSDVVAARDSKVLQLDRPAYDALSQAIPEIGDQILTVLARRMAAAIEHVAPLPPRESTTVAIVPAGSAHLAADFVTTLKATVAGDAGTIVLGPDEFDPDNETWLHDLEDRYERLFLLCSETVNERGTDYLTFATRNCDCVCLVVDTSDRSSKRRSPHEDGILANASTCPVHVVLWSQQAAKTPRPCSPWLAQRKANLRHHVWGDRPGSIARWLRFLSGTALGMVLCGGGALGTAHLGAVKALQEHGYDIDMFGGTSVGAAMAAALASRMHPDEIMDRFEDIFVRSKAMSRLAFPLYGLLDHHGFDTQMKKHYGGWDLEDLPLNYFAVSTSLTTNDINIHRHGALWKAVRASGSIPAILPPLITHDGEVLIDGALVDNLPVSTMRELKAGPNIVLSFQSPQDWRIQSDYESMPTRWQTIWRILTRGKRPGFPPISEVLSRTMVVTARRRENMLDMQDDILIEMPTVQDMGTLEWRKGRQQYDLAYQAMSEILSRSGACADDDMQRRLAVLRDAAMQLSDGQ